MRKFQLPSSSKACTLFFAGLAMLCMGSALAEDLPAGAPAAAPVQAASPAAQVSFPMVPITANITNTDSQRLNAASDQDNWRLHGRTYDNQRFSPLTQINKGNVKQLKPVALIQTGVLNSLEETPIVIDGIMYVETAFNNVEAFNAVTGEELWSYVPTLESSDLCCGPQSRGVAVANGKVFINQLDGHVVALDARNGKVIWKTVNSELLPQPTSWYTFTSAPQVYNGLVLVGSTGAEWPTRGFLAALDENTGKLVWRFWDTPGPDDPNFTGSWEGESWKVGGGSIWNAAAVDPKNDMVFIAIGNPNPDYYGGTRKGNNIYTDCIVALNAKTGKVVWYYQQVAHDVWDLDSAAPVMLFDTVDDSGKTVPAAAEANKNGWLYIVNRLTGKLIRRSDAFTLQDLETMTVPPDDKARVYLPSNHGGAMWQPSAYSPLTHYFYQLGINQAAIHTAQPTPAYIPGTKQNGQLTGAAPVSAEARRAAQATMVPESGNISAIDVNSGKIAWQVPNPHYMIGGVLATASNLVFTGEVAGNFLAFDAKTGKKLWSYHLGIGVCTPPVTYRVKGIQYIAVGASGCHDEEGNMKSQGRPIFGNSIEIFALSGKN